jgi:chemotaxis protein CheX
MVDPLLRYPAKDEEYFYSDGEDSAQSQPSMKESINPFIIHTANVFRKMLGWSIQRLSVNLKSSHVPTYHVSGVISLSGQVNGTIVLSLSRKVAFKVADVMLGKDVSQLNEDVMDAVCELTNIVSGRASGDLDNYETKIGLPSVLIGRTKVAPFPNGLKPVCIEFECPGGPLTLEVGLELPSASETKMEATAIP